MIAPTVYTAHHRLPSRRLQTTAWRVSLATTTERVVQKLTIALRTDMSEIIGNYSSVPDASKAQILSRTGLMDADAGSVVFTAACNDADADTPQTMRCATRAC